MGSQTVEVHAMSEPDETMIALTADIVAAHVSNNSVAVNDISSLIQQVHSALTGLGSPAIVAIPLEPSVSIRSSIKPDYIVCLDCGKKAKMLKRHLMAAHGLDVEGYRQKWGLTADYPMVAPNYADTRRALALKAGLGRKLGQKMPPRKAGAKPWPKPKK
jgi:predicted transcriptional regulator